MARDQIIHLHKRAPKKPLPGQPCNGCGVCCAVETCPVARLFLLQRQAPCRALTWNEDAGRYDCGLLCAPRAHLRWLPARLEPALRRWVARRIAAGAGCDSLLDAIG